jgi:hypothetical protein
VTKVQFVCRDIYARKPRNAELRATKRGALFDAPLFALERSDYAQVIRPAVMLQTFADSVCDAAALHEGGGPAK